MRDELVRREIPWMPGASLVAWRSPLGLVDVCVEETDVWKRDVASFDNGCLSIASGGHTWGPRLSAAEALCNRVLPRDFAARPDFRRIASDPFWSGFIDELTVHFVMAM